MSATLNAAVVAQPTALLTAADSGPADRARVEAFASSYVETKNYAAAYRATFDTSDMSPGSVWTAASRFARQTDVVAAIRARLEAAAKATIVTVAELLQHQYEIATADPREVVWTSEHACRYCWGADNQYQWRDMEEFDLACAAAIDKAVREGLAQPVMPKMAGLFGFTAHRAPNDACEHCKGVGQPVVHIRDMRSLTGPAAKLIKGVKQDRFGAITVELHDQQKALDACNRIVGAYKDALTVHQPPAAAVPLPADLPRERVGEAYLEMVR